MAAAGGPATCLTRIIGPDLVGAVDVLHLGCVLTAVNVGAAAARALTPEDKLWVSRGWRGFRLAPLHGVRSARPSLGELPFACRCALPACPVPVDAVDVHFATVPAETVQIGATSALALAQVLLFLDLDRRQAPDSLRSMSTVEVSLPSPLDAVNVCAASARGPRLLTISNISACTSSCENM